MKKTMKLASRGKRLGAALIDAALPIAAYIIFIVIAVASAARNATPYGYGYENEFGYGYGYGYGYNTNTGGSSAVLLAVIGLLFVVYIVVELIMFAKAQSIGKAILGLQVVSSKDGSPLGFWKMVLRDCVVKCASSSVCGLGYIWVLIDDKNRGWHDKILDTYVVDIKESEMLNRAYNTYTAPAAPAAARPAETEQPKAEALPAAEPAPAIDAPAEAAYEAPADVIETTAVEVTEASAENAQSAEAAKPENMPRVIKPAAGSSAPVIRLDVDGAADDAADKGDAE